MSEWILTAYCAVSSAFGAQIPADWVSVFEALQRGAFQQTSPPQIDWQTYYRSQGSQQMQWAVPNTILNGAPAGPSFPPPQMFPGYPTYP